MIGGSVTVVATDAFVGGITGYADSAIFTACVADIVVDATVLARQFGFGLVFAGGIAGYAPFGITLANC